MAWREKCFHFALAFWSVTLLYLPASIMPKSSKCQKWWRMWLPFITQVGGPQSWALSCPGLCKMPPEISSQSFPQLIDSNDLHPSCHLVAHHVFLVFYLHFVIPVISHLVEAWGVTVDFYSLNREKGGGILSPGGFHHVPPLCTRDIQWKFRNNASSVLSGEPRLTYPESRKTLLPSFALALFAWLWSTSMLKVHHRESVTFQAILRSLFCYSLKENLC